MEIVLFAVVLTLVVVVVRSCRTTSGDVIRSDRTERDDHAGRATRPATDTAVRPSPAPDRGTAKTPRAVSTTIRGAAYVLDGDSLVIDKRQIRLFGIDAPELQHPYGKKAKWALVSLCKGRSVRAEVTGQDDHGRTVARCFLDDGRDLSEEMVRMGLALDWPKFSGGTYRALEAADARKRLWLAAARQKGQMHVWETYETKQKAAVGK